MFIKKIKLDGYKRFKSLTIDLGNTPNEDDENDNNKLT